ncbi:MAG: T9SS type A sorting domain-containing protein [Lewinellaceae bacterium]|nr:T9SS type A sorting domain-containing protein [Lewinellaceae bacterium]
MKQIKLLLLFCLATAVSVSAQNRRYFDEVFANVKVSADITYAVNATVLYLAPPPNGLGQAVPEALKMDVYEPEGDVETSRPLVILMHSGNFLPPQVNGGCVGTRKDASDVAMATRLAKMGYVVAVADYRLGWNPIAGTQTERVYTLINAAYRGVQDSRSCVRFFRKDIAGGNNYKVDDTKITLWGVGTGGYIAAASATLDTITDTYIPKFVTPNGPMVLEFLSGDVNGTKVGVCPPGLGLPYPDGDTLCYPNHVGYSSDFALAVNLGGALGDTSWIEANEIPIISFHNPTDPFAPCETGIVLVPPPVNFPVVEVTGSCGFQPILNAVGNQSAMVNANFSDALSVHAKSINGNIEGFYPFFGNDSSPWAFSASSNPYGLTSDPMCETLAASHTAYIDTIMRYFAPRACAVLGLSADCALVGTKDLNPAQVGLSAIPNPSASDFILKSDAQFVMQNIEIVNLAGQRVAYFENVNNNVFEVKRSNLAPGVYFARVLFKEGISTQKLILH